MLARTLILSDVLLQNLVEAAGSEEQPVKHALMDVDIFSTFGRV